MNIKEDETIILTMRLVNEISGKEAEISMSQAQIKDMYENFNLDAITLSYNKLSELCETYNLT